MAALRDSCPHPRDVKLDAAQSHVPDAHLEPTRQRRAEQSRDGVSAKRGFKREVQPLDDGAFEKPFSLEPRGTIGFPLRDPRIGSNDPVCGFVRIEIVSALSQEHGARYAAFSRAVGPRQDVDGGNPGSICHACAPPLPLLYPIASATQKTRLACEPAPPASACGQEAHRIRRLACRA